MGLRNLWSRNGPHSLLVMVALVYWGAGATAQVFVVGMKTAMDDAVTEFHPTHVHIPDEGLTENGRRELLRNLVAEQAFAHRQLPLGAELTLIANGNLSPRDDEYKKLLYRKGIAIQPGDRVAITAVNFGGDTITIDLNGGPYAKHRFLSHIQINDMPVAAEGPQPTGSRILLKFEGGIPEISAPEVKALLDPVLDFHAKTGEEAYADTLPPKVREAVANHDVLVGMTKRMVIAAMGPPLSKEREHVVEGDPNSARYEEWIYGQTPQPIKFVRFRGERVVRLEVAALGKPIQVFDKNELGEQTPVLQQRTVANGDAQPDEEGRRKSTAPTLKKPGEGGPPVNGGTTSDGRVIIVTPAQPGAPPAPDPHFRTETPAGVN